MKAIFKLFFSENNKFFIIGGTKYLYIIIYLSYVGIIVKTLMWVLFNNSSGQGVPDLGMAENRM